MTKLLFFVFTLCSIGLFAQIGPRGWEDHLSINSSNTLCKAGSKIYASNYAGIITFDEKEWSPRAITKINGLSDVGIRLLRSNPYDQKVLVIYDNCNIDVIDGNGNIKNYPDFKLKALNGKKLVNEVTFNKQLAYLACGFGIVLFDTDKMEIKDTYIIGPNASNMEIFQVALNDSLIFAATPNGIYRSNYKSKALNNYQNWKYDTLQLPRGHYAGIVNAAGRILTPYTPSNVDASKKGKDTLYALNEQNLWEKYKPMATVGQTIVRMGPTFQDMFSTVDMLGLVVNKVADGSIVTHINSFNGEVDYGTLRDAVIGKDYTGNISYWLSDYHFGLFQTYGVYPYFLQNKVTRNGTNRSAIGNIDVYKGKVAVSPSLMENAGIGRYLTEGINLLVNKEWGYLPTLDQNGKAMTDVTSVLFDRKDVSKMWVCSWNNGVALYKDNKQVKLYIPSNTPGMPIAADGLPRCQGLSMDKDGNVWFAHSDQKVNLGVIKKDGSYQSFEFSSGSFTRKTYVDKNGYVWLLHERDGGITVFKPELKGNTFSSPTATVNYKILDNSPGTGNLQSNSVRAYAEDQDGRIWIGTNEGISVFYNSSAIFSGGDYDSQPIKIVQDGNVELLLSKEAVTSIVVDGANNKWVGTLNGGVYCFSPDGITQIYHFTEENSSLYSNTIIDLNYDELTGDVFIGTDVCLQSFRSIIVAGEQEYSNVYAYPNPVKPGYQGTVLVRGLVDNSIVKVTDESGNLVWEVKSNGGQIEWPVTTLNGTRVVSGVYVIYASSTNGELKALTKVLVVN
ncbi:MAG: two-component regulator propeller domain-containing protein [bacterium]|nr:two-component regulator propeller domain-containing protein [bacterium]